MDPESTKQSPKVPCVALENQPEGATQSLPSKVSTHGATKAPHEVVMVRLDDHAEVSLVPQIERTRSV